MGVNINTQKACEYLREAVANSVNKSSDLYYENCIYDASDKQNTYKKDYKIGDVIEFGKYEQEEIFKYTPIKWKIYDIKDGKALLVSELLLDIIGYEQGNEVITWEKSHIRKWLNEDFVKEAFSKDELNKINLTYVYNKDNFKYKTKGGNNTQDKIFLLSYDEIKTYLPNKKQRIAKVTQVTGSSIAVSFCGSKCEEADLIDADKTGWWLRSPGSSQNRAMFVDYNGNISIGGNEVGDNLVAVRPALYINL